VAEHPTDLPTTETPAHRAKEMVMLVATRTYFTGLAEVLGQIDTRAVDRLIEQIRRTRRSGGIVYTLGNGGSAATASHLAVDLAKNTRVPGRPHVRSISLTDNAAVLTAWSNDVSYEDVFAAQLEGALRPNDLVVAISASGNSPNVLAAVRLAADAGTPTFALTGFAGGAVARIASDYVVVPSDSMQVIEDSHLAIVHAVVLGLCDGAC
jgi:D-sedoheptulose 7-phosphate isomerase